MTWARWIVGAVPSDGATVDIGNANQDQDHCATLFFARDGGDGAIRKPMQFDANVARATQTMFEPGLRNMWHQHVLLFSQSLWAGCGELQGFHQFASHRGVLFMFLLDVFSCRGTVESI